MRIREIDEKGEVTNRPELIAAMGFHTGQKVIRKQDRIEGTILKITNSVVQLEVDGKTLSASALSFMEKEWKEAPQAKRDAVSLDWSTYSVVKSPDFKWACMKGLILEAMRKQFDAIKIEACSVYFPRDVKADKAFAIGKLILPCCTNKVSLIEGNESPGLYIGTFSGQNVVLNSCAQFPKDGDGAGSAGCINPFWCVKSHAEKDKCNMSYHVKLNKFQIGASFTLPVMKNCCPLLEGESLMVHHDTKKESKPEELQEVLKRRRVKS